MPAAERTSRMKTMRASVQLNDVHRWARTFLERVKSSTPVRAVDLGLAGDAADPAASDTVRTIR